MREGSAHQDRSYPDADRTVRVDDTDTYQLYAAARELEALLLHEQTRRLADVRSLLEDLHQRDRVQVEEATLDTQAEDVAFQERTDRFLDELATRVQPDAELVELAGQLDDHALGVWREAAASLVDDCPPSFAHLRGRVEEEQRGELRGHAHLVRTEATLGASLARYGLVGRLRHRGEVAELGSKLTTNHQLRERSQGRLALLNAKLLVIDRAEQTRSAWLTGANDVLARGVAATRVLAARTEQATTIQFDTAPVGPTAEDGAVWPRRAS